MFHVGQKVVCVDADPCTYTPAGVGDLDGLTRGEIYTIRRIGESPFWSGTPNVWLVEISRPLFFGGEPGYHTGRFRPVVERKTDISIFQAMLNPKHEQVSA
jgi:hypothetical protein